jgi:probable phosphoglycerate mutase
MLQVYLVRHGETQWNAERRIQGQSDSPLTPHGERQAWQVGERARTLGITHIIASDLGRTRRTAEIIAKPAAAMSSLIHGCVSWIWGA